MVLAEQGLIDIGAEPAEWIRSQLRTFVTADRRLIDAERIPTLASL